MGEPNYKRAYSHLSQAAKMHYKEQGMNKEPLQAETIQLEDIDVGDELSRTLLIEYYSDTQGSLYSP
ncbi:MAG: hypothetical protein IIA77_07995 [Proteobacteria bacterium]|nr:hypothetical protein [Pseudomonadota bacterium]